MSRSLNPVLPVADLRALAIGTFLVVLEKTVPAMTKIASERSKEIAVVELIVSHKTLRGPGMPTIRLDVAKQRSDSVESR